jgi:multidrug resistance efflux pump
VTLAGAQSTLADLQRGPTAEQIASAEAEVERARINLEDAQAASEEATTTTPVDGVVTAVHYEEGGFASGPVISPHRFKPNGGAARG